MLGLPHLHARTLINTTCSNASKGLILTQIDTSSIQHDAGDGGGSSDALPAWSATQTTSGLHCRAWLIV